MTSFTLIDLAAQFDEVAALLKGKSKAEILDWLCQFGDVVYVQSPSGDNAYYGFRSTLDIQAGFRLTEDGSIFLMGDHTLRAPKNTET